MDIEQIKNIIQTKVSGVWETAHDGSGHRYRNTITGNLQRSVTTKLGILSKPHLTKWSINMAIQWLQVEDRWQRLNHDSWREEMINGAQMAHLDVRDDAGGVGTQAHNAIERYINDWIASGVRPADMKSFALPTDDPRAIASMRAVEMFFVKHDIVPIASELLVGMDKHSAGTLDFLCFMNGKLSLLDWKTSNSVDQISYSAQVAAYKFFFERMTSLKIQQCKILHLSKNYDKFEVWKLNNVGKAWKAFKQICSIYDWIYDGKEKISKDIKKIKI